MSPVCDAIVVFCFDFRFQQYLRAWTDRYLSGQTFDLVGYAGSTKELDVILGQIDLAVRLHQVARVLLVHHENCAAYGAESTYERHAADLGKAEGEILARYPHLGVENFYARLDGSFEPVS